jgi:enolase-phosphatase E1
MIKAIVTDIEGTTTQLSFVKEVLFPYAHQHLPDYLAQHHQDPEVKNILDEARQLLNDHTLSDQQLTQQFLDWIEQDKKITPLKTLQGLIWQAGYAKGELKSHVYPDAIDQLRAWHQHGLQLAIFSSGSILAQKLLFAHTEQGDLTPLFSAYFDTTTGPKNSEESYKLIATALNLSADKILFLSDIEAELDAAQAAGMQTCGLVREANVQITKHATVQSFNEIIF